MDMGSAPIAGTSSAGAFPRNLRSAVVAYAGTDAVVLDAAESLSSYAIGHVDRSITDPPVFAADAIYCGPY